MSPRTKEIIDPALPLLERNRAFIESIKRETFDYGPLPVHKLDVYYPLEGSDSSAGPPIIIFFYGGGFTRGSRSSGPSYLVHNNLGAFFASRGILTVIPDYRLVPSIKFPKGSEDVRDAIEWTAKHFSASSSQIFVVGHSAGGVHLTGSLLAPEISSKILLGLRGVVLIGVPMTMPAGQPAAISYYGSPKAMNTFQPLSLLKRSNKEAVSALPPVRALVAGSEPRYISTSMRSFSEALRKKGGAVEEYVLEGHDHLSPILALSSGSGEEWGLDLVKWITELTTLSNSQMTGQLLP